MSTPTPSTNRRRGFSLIELIVVAVIGSLVLIATYNVLITNQRTYAVQNAQVVGQQQLRNAMEMLAGEIREISARDGDLLSIREDSLSVRVMRDFGIVCANNEHDLVPTLTVKKMTDWFEVGDSVYIFADNDATQVVDDDWLMAAVTAVDTLQSCTGTDDAMLLTFASQNSVFAGDDILNGAPVRAHELYQYRTANWNSRMYLGRSAPGTSFVPMVGPLWDYIAGYSYQDGVRFFYYDADGNATTVPTDVRRIDVMVRTWSPVTNNQGENVTDSLLVSVYTRN